MAIVAVTVRVGERWYYKRTALARGRVYTHAGESLSCVSLL